MLKLFILVALIVCSYAEPLLKRQGFPQKPSQQDSCSQTFKLNNLWYSLEERINISGMPADLSVHWKSGKVFFTLISEDMKMELKELRPDGQLESIRASGLGQSTTVDNVNDIVYLATDNGVYKYKEDGTVEPYTARGEDVMYIAVTNDGNVMYIATWPQNRVHKITNSGQKQETFPLIPNGHGLVIDTKNNIYFVASKTTYILKNGNNVSIKIKGLPSDKINGVFVSKSGEVYAMDEQSNLYVVDPDATTARHIGSFNINGVNSFAIDSSNNVLIAVNKEILKFKAHERNPCGDL